jgi:hypothetical protein
MKKNDLSNKEIKEVAVAKPTKTEYKAVDTTDFPEFVNIVTTKATKHFALGVNYEVGKEIAGILIGKGVAKLA